MRFLNPRWHDTTALHDQYQQAQPFPYVVMDDFLDPGIMQVARAELLRYDQWDYDDTDYVRGRQVNKFFAPSPRPDQTEASIQHLRQHAAVTMSMLNYLQSSEFRAWLEQVTGIPQLLSDTDWLGGGIHKVTHGGLLDIHADFNLHWRQQLHRRLNLLIYLNPNWQSTWGGALELWDQQMTQCQHRILPEFNRAVLFRITDDAFHGHPDPVQAPEHQPRLSLAMYYYTQDRPESEKSPDHPVLWARRDHG